MTKTSLVLGFLIIATLLLSGCETTPQPLKANRAMPAKIFNPPETSDQWDTPPRFLKGKGPTMPYAALRHADFPRRGIVEVQFVIRTNGSVGDIQVMHATHPQYAAGVLHNLRRWKFEPATRNGIPVEVAIRQNFVLDPYPDGAPVL